MTTAAFSGYVAMVVPQFDGYSVSCSCGYLVMGWPTQALAQTDMDNHVARAHPPDDSSRDRSAEAS